MKNRSRLSRRLEKQSQNNLFISIFGIIIVVVLLFKFGVPALINFSLLLSGSKSTNDSSQNNSSEFISPPALDPLVDATNSAKVKISGKAGPKEKISLYINNEVIDKTDVKTDGTFVFNDIELSKGENIIKAKTIAENKNESDFSISHTIYYKNEPPALSIDSPSDGQSFSKDESFPNITGKTNAGSKVTVNDFWAIVDNEGNFSYSLKLKEGENKIKVIATDLAGNRTEKEVKVNYSP